MIEICEKNKCKSCGLCIGLCPKKAISFTCSDDGEQKIQINQDLCIDCMICKKNCPEANNIDYSPIKICYAGAAKSTEVYKKTSSGGIATLLTKKILQSKGVVYGAVIKNGEVEHVRIDNLKKLYLLSGSKYVRSNLAQAVHEIKEDLKNKKIVLFIGTPCQVSAVKKLDKNSGNLLTVDLVCHGTPPFNQFKKNLNENGVHNISTLNYVFRDKGMNLTVKDKNNIVYKKAWWEDYYYSAFMCGLNYYESCYSCQYAQNDRIGDITLGDFWGINRNTLISDLKKFKYLSLILINTQKGIDLFENIKEDIVYQEREINEAVQGNAQLREPSTRHQDRDRFLKEYRQKGMKYAVKKTGVRKKMLKNKVKTFLVTVCTYIKK